jgi:ABC-2 type transport system ATP-binding protein
MNQPALVADNVGRQYRPGGSWALREVSFVVPSGAIAALVGPNGAGKTTLIRSWIGFESPDEGRVLVENVDPKRHRSDAIRRVSYVPQAGALYRELSTEDHFRLASVYRPAFDIPAASARIAAVGIPLGRRVGELSGGEQAQVALAIALASGTRILLLDEPLASLDPLARHEFLSELAKDIRQTGATALLSSHIVTDVEWVCDRLVILSAGRLILSDSIDHAKAVHRITTSPASVEDNVVGTFTGTRGNELTLIRQDDSEITEPPYREATLEEIVFGYLSGARTKSRGSR